MSRPRGLYKRGNVWWIAYTLPDGKTERRSAGTSSKKQAEALLLKRKAEILEGKMPVRLMKRYTFQELANEYLVWAERQKTYRDKVYHIKHFITVFGNIPLASFNTKLLETWQSKKLQEVSPATVNRLMATLKHMLGKAVDWGMVGEDALKTIRRVKPLKTPPGRLRYLSQEDCQALIEACSIHLKPIVMTALNTGMRRGEILGLRWEQVDLKHGFILLDITKNGERREIPINATLRATIEAIPHGLESKYVFFDRNGNPFKDVKKSFHTALKRAGIRDFRFHDLRHTFASHLVMAGEHIVTVQELLGHKTLTMTLRYAHLAPDHKVKAVMSLDERLWGEDKNIHVLHNYFTISERREHEVCHNPL
ncbi:MAG: tyrosine-type recombinase/integrase [Planctomycetota bacterium]